MSRKSRFEYIGEKRRAYAKSGKAKRSRILDEVCETLGYTRKYVIKLLSGNIRYRERKEPRGPDPEKTSFSSDITPVFEHFLFFDSTDRQLMFVK